MHLSDRQQWAVTAKTPVQSLLTIVGAKDLARVGATRLTLVGAIELTLVGVILITRDVGTGMCDGIDRDTELSSSSVNPRTRRTPLNNNLRNQLNPLNPWNRLTECQLLSPFPTALRPSRKTQNGHVASQLAGSS